MATAYYRGLGAGSERGTWSLEERWCDVEMTIDLRPGDEVLDVGCAEGLESFELAARARRVRAFDVRRDRIATAESIRRRRGVENVSFEVGSICEIDLEPLSYDLVCFLGVFHHLPSESRLGALRKCLHAARRQMIMRTPVGGPPRAAVRFEILETIDGCGFEGSCFATRGVRGGNLILATRRGVDVAGHSNPAPTLAVWVARPPDRSTR